MKAEWEDVFKALDDMDVYHKKGGLHIDNDDVDNLSDELDDVADQYKELAKTPWQKAFDAQGKKAMSNKEA